MKTLLTATLCVVGGVAIFLSLVWNSMFGHSGWTAEEMVKLQQLDDQVIQIHYKIEAAKSRPGQSSEQLEQKYQEAIAVRDQLRARRDAALESPAKTASYLRYGGIAVLLAGIVASFVFKGD
jgi:hypothetical protein